MYAFEPPIKLADLRYRAGISWEMLDAEASRLVGRPVTAVPSIRVGILWAADYLQLNRHSDDVLVPQFLGRCILNAINRRAFPVTSLSEATKLVVVLNQFGFAADFQAVEARTNGRTLPFLEDSPHGIMADEHPFKGSLGRFISFSKVLPVLKGAGFISDNESLIRYFRDRRTNRSWSSWAALAILASLRRREQAVSGSAVADLAYELYPHFGDNALLRSNFFNGLQAWSHYEEISSERLEMLRRLLPETAKIPEGTRLAYAIPFFAGSNAPEAQAVFAAHGFDSTFYHFDVAGNIFAPRYEKVLLIPMNPAIPAQAFAGLVGGLSELRVRVS